MTGAKHDRAWPPKYGLKPNYREVMLSGEEGWNLIADYHRMMPDLREGVLPVRARAFYQRRRDRPDILRCVQLVISTGGVIELRRRKRSSVLTMSTINV
ncbi:MAG: hypothetical protein AAF205_11610 [Pseudomonadota bacterium]